MIAKQLIVNDNYEYWIKRAKGYSEVNQEELAGIQRTTWKELLDREIMEHFKLSPADRANIRILDIGAGPGFLSIILAELGYSVTAADFAETMLAEAHKNAGDLAEKIVFRKENAMDLKFEDEAFDVIINRNLTWNLPDPEKAYEGWLRVLKKGGILFIFDACWYGYLRDEVKRKEYLKDREMVKEKGFEDYDIGENFDKMEAIADTLPLTGILRPDWDRDVFMRKGVQAVECVENIGEKVYSEKEKVNYASTPMFMIKVVK
ncbi:class I SAM-dependent methyltransferase [Butyrivibrio sp. XBB1001]|uniref:class I SAM-dependent methyltransferase n=1 Tax=Butyrivibrio sp. XBB1001 TaxID=1280682 RepID=UPI000414DF71|nr:class I SAM-dependent methyltransferase [Butyrivibrio sp. XBB1001]